MINKNKSIYFEYIDLFFSKKFNEYLMNENLSKKNIYLNLTVI